MPPGAPAPLPKSSAKLDVVEFRDQPLGEAMRLFSEQTGFNIVASPEARKVECFALFAERHARGRPGGPVQIKRPVAQAGPGIGMIRIYTAKEYQRDLSSFREEQTEVFTLLYPNPVDVATAIRSIYGDRVILNLQSPRPGHLPGLDSAVQPL